MMVIPWYFLVLASTTIISIVYLFTKLKYQKIIKHVLQKYDNRRIEDQSELQSKLDAAVDQEQKRIANEIHDDTVQRMVALRFRLEQLHNYRLQKEVSLEIDDLRKELDEIISALRFLIKGLTQPRFDEFPLATHIKELAEKLSVLHHQKVFFEVTNLENEFGCSPAVNQELYYLVHEAVHNYLKGSLGFQIWIRIQWGNELVISIKDNGQGIQHGRGYGLGMNSMNKRADRIGAELIFNSTFTGLSVLIKLKKDKASLT